VLLRPRLLANELHFPSPMAVAALEPDTLVRDRTPRSPRDQLDLALRVLDPVDLRSPILCRLESTAFVTEDILVRQVARLQRYRVNSSATLVDLGCGTGGVSLWLAERTGARLHGIDTDALAIGRARRNTRDFLLSHIPTFECASFDSTWIEPSTAHAIVSLDALHLATRPAAALAEAHRILVSNGILHFNVYVADDDPGAAAWVRNLEAVGFAMLDIDDQTHVWRSVMTARHRARLEHADVFATRFSERTLAAELATSRTMLGLDHGPSVIANTRRVELVARKDTTLAARRRTPRASSAPRPIDE
jgi:SAM-dependent methyltransferase